MRQSKGREDQFIHLDNPTFLAFIEMVSECQKVRIEMVIDAAGRLLGITDVAEY